MYVSAPCGGAPTETTKTLPSSTRERAPQKRRSSEERDESERYHSLLLSSSLLLLLSSSASARAHKTAAGAWTVRRAASFRSGLFLVLYRIAISFSSIPSVHPTVGEGRNSKQFSFFFPPFHDTNDSKDNSFRLFFLSFPSFFPFPSPSRYRIDDTYCPTRSVRTSQDIPTHWREKKKYFFLHLRPETGLSLFFLLSGLFGPGCCCTTLGDLSLRSIGRQQEQGGQAGRVSPNHSHQRAPCQCLHTLPTYTLPTYTHFDTYRLSLPERSRTITNHDPSPRPWRFFSARRRGRMVTEKEHMPAHKEEEEVVEEEAVVVPRTRLPAAPSTILSAVCRVESTQLPTNDLPPQVPRVIPRL